MMIDIEQTVAEIRRRNNMHPANGDLRTLLNIINQMQDEVEALEVWKARLEEMIEHYGFGREPEMS